MNDDVPNTNLDAQNSIIEARRTKVDVLETNDDARNIKVDARKTIVDVLSDFAYKIPRRDTLPINKVSCL